MAPNPGDSIRVYTHNTVGDDARVHFGDVYYQGKTPEASILDSLRFPGMERYHNRPLESYPGAWSWLLGALDDEEDDTGDDYDYMETEYTGHERSRRRQRAMGRSRHIHDSHRGFRATRSRPAESPSSDPLELKYWDEEEYLDFRRKETSKFQDWIRRSDQTFWICGKAGSGKSCLMKYLGDQPRTTQLLREWAGVDVVIASFFFWSGGDELEKSLTGLLRSITHQLLSAQPDMMEKVLAQRWRAQNERPAHQEPWTVQELSETLRRIAQHGFGHKRFCFFIDGLDEFDGEHYDLIQDLEHFRRNAHLKLCVSSRPWNVFKSAYGEDNATHFVLHDLTKYDVLNFATGLIKQDDRFERLANEQRDLIQLVYTVQYRAEGVFLWVKLAIKSLRRGFGECDTLETLWERLSALPKELDDMLQHIFDSVEGVYQKHMARTLIWLLADTSPRESLSLMLLSFVQQADEIEFGIKAPLRAMTYDEIQERLSTSKMCAAAWCKDLVDIHYIGDHYNIASEVNSSSNNARLAHRSVYDFVQLKEGDGTLRRLAGADFDPKQLQMQALLSLSKSTGKFDMFSSLALNIMSQWNLERDRILGIFQPEIDRRSMYSAVLKELDRVGEQIKPRDCTSHWTIQERRPGSDFLVLNKHCTFTSYCIAWQLPPPSLDTSWSELTIEEKTYSLISTLEKSMAWSDQFWFRDLEMFRNLLERTESIRALPFQEWAGHDIWQYFLLKLPPTYCNFIFRSKIARERDFDITCTILHEFLKRGFDPETRLSYSSLRQSLSHELHLSFGGLEADEKTQAAETYSAIEAFDTRAYVFPGKNDTVKEVLHEYFPQIRDLLIKASRQKQAADERAELKQPNDHDALLRLWW